jgi:hypothetical protein
MGASTTDKVIGSIQHLEYSIAGMLLNKNHYRQQNHCHTLKGNNELKDIYIGEILCSK